VQADVHRIANNYQAERGQPPIRGDMSNVVMPHGGTRMIARQYGTIPQYDSGEAASRSYAALEEETGRQFDIMTRSRSKGGLGLSAHTSPVDPYGRTDTSQPFADKPNEIMRDLKADVGGNSRIRGLATATTGGSDSFKHPDTNDMFRVVHDLFGHVAANRGIDRHGEEAAYQHHRQMFSPAARPALASELRGQTAYLLTRGEFVHQTKHGLGYDSGPLHPQQFGENPLALSAEAQEENRKQGL